MSTKLRVLVVHENLGTGHTRNARLVAEALRAREDVEVLLEAGSELFDVEDAKLAGRAWNALIQWDLLRAADLLVNRLGRLIVLPISEAIATPRLLRRLASLDVDIIVGTSDLWNRVLGTHARRASIPFFILPCEMNVYLDQMHPDATHLCMFAETARAIRSFDVSRAYFAAPLQEATPAWGRISYVLRFWRDYLVGPSPLLAAAQVDHPARNEARCEVIGPVAERSHFERTSREAARRDLGLPLDRHLVVVISGSLGGRLVERATLELVRSLDSRFHIVALCGNSAAPRQRLLREQPAPGRAALSVHGFTPHVAGFLAAADVLVARPSAGTFVEGLLARTPMIVVGHVTSNDAGPPALLEANQLGHVCTDLRALPGLVERVVARRLEMAQGLEAWVARLDVPSFQAQQDKLRDRILSAAPQRR